MEFNFCNGNIVQNADAVNEAEVKQESIEVRPPEKNHEMSRARGGNNYFMLGIVFYENHIIIVYTMKSFLE